jgi:hypothetical protein
MRLGGQFSAGANNLKVLEHEAIAPRHWMLDNSVARDFLKAVLRTLNPNRYVPYFKKGGELDPELSLIIEALGFQDLKKPDPGDELAISLWFFKLQLMAMSGLVLAVVPWGAFLNHS